MASEITPQQASDCLFVPVFIWSNPMHLIIVKTCSLPLTVGASLAPALGVEILAIDG